MKVTEILNHKDDITQQETVYS